MLPLIAVLAKEFHPLTLPAPHGRGPEGWPLNDCLVCGRPIPWPSSYYHCHTPMPPAVYYAKKYCGRPCLLIGRHSPDLNRVQRQPLINFEHRALQHIVVRHHLQHPLLHEITHCRRCHAGLSALFLVDVGLECFHCGTIMYARDASWGRELAFSGRRGRRDERP